MAVTLSHCSARYHPGDRPPRRCMAAASLRPRVAGGGARAVRNRLVCPCSQGGLMRLAVAGGWLTVMDVAMGAETGPDRGRRRYQRTLFDAVAGLYQASRPGY